MVLFGGLWTNNRNANSDDDTSNTSTTTGGSSAWPDEEQPSLTAEFDAEDTRGVLKLCLFYLSSYVIVAVIAYSFVLERWTIIDSIYFAVSTFTTVGYGDLQPATEIGRLFTIVFACYGVIILGVFIGVVGHAISEAQQKAVKKLRKKRKKKLLKAMFSLGDNDKPQKRKAFCEKDSLMAKNKKYSWLSDHVTLLDDVWQVFKREAPEILTVMILAYILGVREGWTFTNTVYFAIMSASTTGYGDYTPATQIDKLYCVFFLPLSVAVFGEVLGRIATIYITRRAREAEYKHLHKAITLFDLEQMDTDDDGCVTCEDFLSYMLVALNKVDQDSIDDVKSTFYSLAPNGTLKKEDLVGFTQRKNWQEIKLAVHKQVTSEQQEQKTNPRHKRMMTVG